MKIKFSIIQEFDIEQIIKNEKEKKWFWKNSLPSIPEETRPEELTDAQKIALIKLLIYEGWLGREDDLANLPDSNFALINEPVETTNEQPILQKHEAIADHDCYCGTIKKGQIYNKNCCDLGCMYPGA